MKAALKRIACSTALWLLCSANVWAFDANSFQHQVPQIGEGAKVIEEFPVSIKAPGAAKARVLISTLNGYKVIPMQQRGKEFQANIRFEELALLNYQFQLEGKDGSLFQSEYFSVRQPASQEFEAKLRELTIALERLSAKKRQVENSLYALKSLKPAELAKRKGQEMARALVALSQREREVSQARSFADKQAKLFTQRLLQTQRGQLVEENRKFLQELYVED